MQLRSFGTGTDADADMTMGGDVALFSGPVAEATEIVTGVSDIAVEVALRYASMRVGLGDVAGVELLRVMLLYPLVISNTRHAMFHG